MGTNRVALRTVEQFMADYKPIYVPIYSAFLANSQSYSQEVGKINFNRLEAVGDLRGKRLTPKDTVMHAIQARESTKAFKKYFLASEFAQSSLQDNSRTEQVIAQVLEEMNKQFDDMLLLGEGTSSGTVMNNGLFWSGDSNYTFNDPSEDIDGDGVDPLIDFHKRLMTDANAAKQIDGNKLIIFYGEDVVELFNSVYAASSMPFKKVLGDVLGSDFSMTELPTAVTPASEQGWIIATLPQVKMHYTVLPSLRNQGIDDRKMESWHHFLSGSCMLDPLVPGAIIRTKIDGVDLGS